MLFFIPNDYYIEQSKTVIEYVHEHGATSKSKTSSSVDTSEGMTNHSSSCWMISVIQALRASPSFRELYLPTLGRNEPLRQELFHLFDIVEGTNGHGKRQVSYDETKKFKSLLIANGLKVKMDDGYLEEPFMRFLLQKLQVPEIRYSYSSQKKYKSEIIMKIPLTNQKERRQLQTLVNGRKIAFRNSKEVPEFLPLFLDRPVERVYHSNGKSSKESLRIPIIPTQELHIPVTGSGNKARFELVSMTIGRDSKDHAYSYVLAKDYTGKTVWVEYNDSLVLVHPYYDKNKRRENSFHTPLEDACKHAGVLVYQFIGWT